VNGLDGAILPPVQTCLECGNHDMRVRIVDGAPIHECGMCGARFGERAAVESLTFAEEAAERGVDAAVWPLVRALSALPGLCVRSSQGGDVEARTLPFVELGATSAESLHQLENLAKSLRLGVGSVRLHWVIEVQYQHHLAFVLKPRHPGGPVSLGEARDARVDLDVLFRQFERDRKLRWWRHADGGPTG
jgi:hypothetical protein